jgi:monoamine oxidase
LVTPSVQINTPIKSVTYSSGKVELTDAKGNAIEATKVIVTVPLSVMKSGDISFNPGLPSSMTASLSNLGMDSSVRVILDFKKNFWGPDSNMIWGGETVPQYFNTGFGRSQYYRTLSLTIYGPKAAQLSALGTGMIDSIIAELDSIYGVPAPGIPNPATQFIRRGEPDPNDPTTTPPPLFLIYDWSKEPFIKGGFSYPLAGTTIDDHKNIGAPIMDTLFFAGEATDINGDAGTINGALASAERVVEEIIKSIQNP